MLYNKHQVTKTNDKKILHKIGKHWVTLSVATLMALGGYAMSSTLTTHAATNLDNGNNSNTTSTKGVTDKLNSHLQTDQQNVSQGQLGNQNEQSITQAANAMHQHIISHGLQNDSVMPITSQDNNVQAPKVNIEPGEENESKGSVSDNYVDSLQARAQSDYADNNTADLGNIEHEIAQHSDAIDANRDADARNYANQQNAEQSKLSNSNAQKNAKQSPKAEQAPTNEVGDVDDWQKSSQPYYGLNYRYSPSTKTLEFTSGTLNWTWSWPYSSYSDSYAFISSGKHGMPANFAQAQTIKFDNGVTVSKSSKLNYMFVSDFAVQNIDLGNTFFNNWLPNYSGNQLNGMFQSDKDLTSLSIPYGIPANGYDNDAGMFKDTTNLHEMTIYSTTTHDNDPHMDLSGENLSDTNWYNSNDTRQSNPITLSNIQPGTYVSKGHKLPPKRVIPKGNDWNNLTEGSANVDINGNNHTITVSGGTLLSARDISHGHGAYYEEFMSDIKDSSGKFITSDQLPNTTNGTPWTLKFNNVTAPSDMSFVFCGGKDSGNTQNALGKYVKTIDLSGLNFSGTHKMQGMLINSNALQNVIWGNSPRTQNVSDISMMLGSDASLQNADLSKFNGANVTQIWDLFDKDPNLSNVTLSKEFSPQGNDNVRAGEMFASDPSLQFKNIHWNGFNTSHVKYFYGMFRNDKNLGAVQLPSSFDTSNGTDFGAYVDNKGNIDPTSQDGMFQSDGTNVNSRHTPEDSQAGAIGMTSLDLSKAKFDTSNAKYMQAMFADDKKLKSITLGKEFNTSKVTNMKRMFANSDGISDLNLPSSFDTSNARDSMSDMFKSDYENGGLRTITINNPKTIIDSNAWTSWKGYEHPFYKETGKLTNSSDKPQTISQDHDFTDSNLKNSDASTGTFTAEDTNQGHDASSYNYSSAADVIKGDINKASVSSNSVNSISASSKNATASGYAASANNDVNSSAITTQSSVDASYEPSVASNWSSASNEVSSANAFKKDLSNLSANMSSASIANNSSAANNDLKSAKSDMASISSLNSQISTNNASGSVAYSPMYDNVTPQFDTDFILFEDGKESNQIVKSYQKYGEDGTTVKIDSDIPSGYKLDSNDSFKFDNGIHTFKVEPNNNANDNIPVDDNAIDVHGVITLHFHDGSTDIKDIPVWYSGQTTANHKINILSDAEYNTNAPADYINKIIDGFNTAGYKLDNDTNSKPSNYDFMVDPADTTYVNGSTREMRKDITLDFSIDRSNDNSDSSLPGHRGTDTIDYNFVDPNGNNHKEGFDVIKGNNGSDSALNKVPNGYHVDPVDNNVNSDGTITIQNGSHNVNILPNAGKATINYMHNGQKVGSDTINGNSSSATDAGNNSININGNNHPNLSDKYVVNDNTSVPFDNDSHNINVDMASATDRIVYVASDGTAHGSDKIGGNLNSDIKINKSNEPGIENGYQLVNSDNSGNGNEFTNNNQTYTVAVKGVTENPNGNDPKYQVNVYVHKMVNGQSDGTPQKVTLNEKGANGSTFAINANDSDITNHLAKNSLDGFTATGQDYTRFGKLTTNGIIGIPNNNIDFYYAENDANGANAITVNYNNGNKKISSGNFSKPLNTTGNVTSDVTVPAGYRVKPNQNLGYKATDSKQTINIQVAPMPASDLPSDTNRGNVRLNLIFKSNGKWQNEVTQNVNEGGVAVGNDFDIQAPAETGYQLVSGDDFRGQITPSGANPDTHTFVYDAVSHTTPIHFHNQNGSNVNPSNGSNASGNTNGPVIFNIPKGYHLPSGVTYHYDNKGNIIDNNGNKVLNNDINIIGDKVVGTARVTLLYKQSNGKYNDVTTAKDAQVVLHGEVGGSQTISPVQYAKKGYSLPTQNWVINFTPSDINANDQDGFSFSPSHTFEYDATTADPVEVAYIDTDDGNKVVGHSDLSNFGGIVGQKVRLAQAGTGVNSDGTYYDLNIPAGYHLAHTYNPIILRNNPQQAQQKATRLNLQIPSNVGMVLTVALGADNPNDNHTSNSGANNRNNKSASAGSSSASSSNNNVPNKPASNNGSKASSNNVKPNNNPASNNNHKASSANSNNNTPAKPASNGSRSASSANGNHIKPASSSSSSSNNVPSKPASGSSNSNHANQPASSASNNGGSIAPSSNGSHNASSANSSNGVPNSHSAFNSASNDQPSIGNVTDTVYFMDNGQLVNAVASTGISGVVFVVIPPVGYKIDGDSLLIHDGTTHFINVEPDNQSMNNNQSHDVKPTTKVDDFVNFVDNGQIVGNMSDAGVSGTAFMAKVPAGYKADGELVMIHNGGPHTVQVSSANAANNTDSNSSTASATANASDQSADPTIPQSGANNVDPQIGSNSDTNADLTNSSNSNHTSSEAGNQLSSTSSPTISSNGNGDTQDPSRNSDSSDHNLASDVNSNSDASDSDPDDVDSTMNSRNAGADSDPDNSTDTDGNTDVDTGQTNSSIDPLTSEDQLGSNDDSVNVGDSTLGSSNNDGRRLPQTGESKSAQMALATLSAILGVNVAAAGAILNHRRHA